MNINIKKYIRAWLLKAEEDLKVIEKLTEYEVIASSAVCFHCQQLTEKVLKAYLICNEVEIKKTHNIEYLLSQCSDFDPAFQKIDPKNLSDFSVDARYPDDIYLPDDEETLEYKELAISIKKFTEERINKLLNMNYEHIITEVKEGILYLTLNRPNQLNALNKAVFSELEDILQTLAKDEKVKCLIITGSGEKAFAAGADIKEFAHFNVEEGKALSANGQRIFKMIELFNKPVIAAVNGFALGGGLELAMACHIRTASDNARFGQPEVSLGVTPGYAGTQRLTQLIGKGKAFELLMTGAMINAAEALNLGLVNYVVGQAELIGKSEELAGIIMKQSPVAVAAVIRCVDAYFTAGVNGFQTEVEEFGKCFGTEDFKEGTDAFMNKRKAVFPGK